MQAIKTKYLSATNTRGARIKAVWGDDSASIPYPHEFNVMEAHRAAAENLRQKVAKKNKYADKITVFTAPLIDGFVSGGEYVFIPNPAIQHLARVLYSRCSSGEAGNPYSIPAIKSALEYVNGGDWQSDAYKKLV